MAWFHRSQGYDLMVRLRCAALDTGILRSVIWLLLTTVLQLATSVAQDAAIRAGHLIDPYSGKVVDNQTILVQAGTIVEVGSQVDVPSQTPLIDLSKYWVLPGLIDAHQHITFDIPPLPRSGSILESIRLKESTALHALRGVKNARTLLEAGFTTIRDLGNDGNYAATDLRQAIERGWFLGPTIINSGKIIGPFGGQLGGIAPESGPFWHVEYIDADTTDEIRKAIRQNIYYGAKVIKLVPDHYSYRYSEQDLRTAVTEAHSAGMAIAVHALHNDVAKLAILAGADSIEHGFDLSDEVLALMKEKGTVLVGTDFPEALLAAMVGALPVDPKAFSERIVDRLRRAHKTGVKLAFGTDASVVFPGRTRADTIFEYLRVWRAAGVPPGEILKAMTINAADLLRVSNTKGTLAAGKAADVIATIENPLVDIEALRKVVFVMKDGRVAKKPAEK